MRDDGAREIACEIYGSAFVAIAAEIGVLDDLAITDQIDRARHGRSIFFDIDRDRVRAIRIRLRANGAKSVQTHVPGDLARIAHGSPITRCRWVFAIVHQATDFVEPNRGGLDQVLIGPRFHRFAAHFASFAIDDVIGFIRPIRPSNANDVESTIGHRNLSRRIELVGTIAAIPFRHGPVGRKANRRLLIEIDDGDE